MLQSSGFQKLYPVQLRLSSRLNVKYDNRNAQKAWERRTLGLLDADGSVQEDERMRQLREARIAWGHIHNARRAIGDGVEGKARASYNYYLQRFRNHSAVLVTDVFLRLAIFEHNLGNTKEARRAFRLGARTVHDALKANSNENKCLRERGATLYCSWGLHEYRFAGVRTDEERVKRSRGFLQHAARMDASKSPVLAWSRFQERSSNRLHSSVIHDIKLVENHAPVWKIKQAERYRCLLKDLLTVASRGDRVEIEPVVRDFERRAGKRAPALSPQLLGKWRLVYATPTKDWSCNGHTQACEEQKIEHVPRAALDIVLAGPSKQSSTCAKLEINCECECRVEGATTIASFRPKADNVVEFNALASLLDGHATITYLDSTLMILRRARHGNTILLFERPETSA